MTCRYCDQSFGLHTIDCPNADRPAALVPERATRRRYVPPSRAGRIPRAEYLSAITVAPEHKRAVNRAKQARYRARKKAAA